MQLFETVKVDPTEYQKNIIAKTTTADVSANLPKTSLLRKRKMKRMHIVWLLIYLKRSPLKFRLSLSGSYVKR